MDKSDFYLNPFHLEQVSLNANVVITLINGKKILVLNTPDEITEKLICFWNSLFNTKEKIKSSEK